MCLSKLNFQIVGFEQWLFTLTTGFWWRTYPFFIRAVFIHVTFNWKFRSNLFSFTFHNVDPSELCGMCQHSKLHLVYSSDWIKTYHIYLLRIMLWVIFLSSRCYHCIRLKYQIMSTANRTVNDVKSVSLKCIPKPPLKKPSLYWLHLLQLESNQQLEETVPLPFYWLLPKWIVYLF